MPGRSGLDKRLPRSRRHGRLQLKIVIRFEQIFTWNVTEFPRPEALLVWRNIIRSGVLAGYGQWAPTRIYTRTIDPVTCVSRSRLFLPILKTPYKRGGYPQRYVIKSSKKRNTVVDDKRNGTTKRSNGAHTRKS